MSRIHWTQGALTLFYQGKVSNDERRPSLFNHPDGGTLDVFDFIARVLTQIPGDAAHQLAHPFVPALAILLVRVG